MATRSRECAQSRRLSILKCCHSHERTSNRESTVVTKRTVDWTSFGLLRLENTGKSLLASLPMAWSRLLTQQVPNGLHLPILHHNRAHAMSERIAVALWLVVVCTQLQIHVLGYWCFNWAASAASVSIIYIHRYNEAWPHAPGYEFYRYSMRIYKYSMRFRVPALDQSDCSICYNYDLIPHIYYQLTFASDFFT